MKRMSLLALMFPVSIFSSISSAQNEMPATDAAFDQEILASQESPGTKEIDRNVVSYSEDEKTGASISVLSKDHPLSLDIKEIGSILDNGKGAVAFDDIPEFDEKSSASSYQSGLYKRQHTNGNWQVFYLNGMVSGSISSCGGDATPYRFVLKQDDRVATTTPYYAFWTSPITSGSSYYCGSQLINFNVVGMLGSLVVTYETINGAKQSIELENVPVCKKVSGMANLLAARDPINTDFKMMNNMKEYDRSRKKGGYTEAYGRIGAIYTRKAGEHSVPLYSYYNPTVTTHGYTIDLSEMSTHPDWTPYGENNGVLGSVHNQQNGLTAQTIRTKAM